MKIDFRASKWFNILPKVFGDLGLVITCIPFNNAQNGALSAIDKVDQIVLVRDPLALRSQWELDRITACNPGDDNLTCVVTIKTDRFEYKRSLVFYPSRSQYRRVQRFRLGGRFR